MPNYYVKVLIFYEEKGFSKSEMVSVTAPSHDEAGAEAIKSLPLKKRKGAVVEAVSRSDTAGVSQQHEGD